MEQNPRSKHKKYCEASEDPVSAKFKVDKKIVLLEKVRESPAKVFKECEEDKGNKFKKESVKGDTRKINLRFDKTVSILFSRPCCELIKLPKTVYK